MAESVEWPLGKLAVWTSEPWEIKSGRGRWNPALSAPLCQAEQQTASDGQDQVQGRPPPPWRHR